MTKITETALADLDAAKRLLSPVHKDVTPTPGRFGFRGELALKFAEQFADEARPPEVKCDQVMTVADVGASTIPFFTGFVQSFEHLQLLAEVLGEKLSADGKYFLFCGNIDISRRYQVAYGGASFYILPLDEATVYNELLDLFGIERSDLKKTRHRCEGRQDRQGGGRLQADLACDQLRGRVDGHGADQGAREPAGVRR